MNQDLIDETLRIASQMAADRGIQIDQASLMQAILAVVGDRNGQDEPHEIAEDALELLGKDAGPSSTRRGRRPF
jgi:hypothetical protein